MEIKDLLSALKNIEQPIQEEEPVFEAVLKPGDRKEISFALNRIAAIRKEIDKYDNLLYSMENNSPKALAAEIASLKEKMQAQKAELNKAWEDLRQQERDAQGQPIKLTNFFKAITKHCKQILKVYQVMNTFPGNSKEYFMYRGIKRSGSDAIYGKPFDVRNPKDSKKTVNDWFNQKVLAAGISANRENSTFVTGRMSQADSYSSNVYIMFPVDGFEFSVAYKYSDLILDDGVYGNMILEYHRDRLKEIREEVQKIRNEYASSGEVSQAVKFPSDGVISEWFTWDSNVREPMNKIKELAEENLIPKELGEEVANMPTNEEFIKFFKLTDRDIYKAVQSGNEICLKTDSYYAIHSKYSKQILDLLKTIDLSNVDLPENFGEFTIPFEEGTVVRSLEGPHKGQLGVVNMSFLSGSHQVVFGKNDDEMLSKEQLELVSSPSRLSANIAYVVINKKSIYYGFSGRITYQTSSGTQVELNDTATVYKVEVAPLSDHPELADNKMYITEGDQVKVINDTSTYFGQIGEVTYVYKGDNNFSVDFGSGRATLRRNVLEKIDPSTEIDTSANYGYTYQIGELVKVIDDPSVVGKWRGRIGKVINRGLDKNGKEAYIIQGAAFPILGLQRTLPIEQIKKLKIYNLDDRVFVKYTTLSNEPLAGTVVSSTPEVDEYRVLLDKNDNEYWFSSEDIISKIDKEPLPKERVPTGFVKGDVVKLTGPSFYDTEFCIGKNAVIDSINGKITDILRYNVDVLDNEGNPTGTLLTYEASNLELVSKAQNKPQTETPYDYKVGDKIKVLGNSVFGNKNYIGQIGTISRAIPNAAAVDGGIAYIVSFSDGGKLGFTPDTIEKYNEDDHTVDDEIKLGDMVFIKHLDKQAPVVKIDPTKTFPYYLDVNGEILAYNKDEIEKTNNTLKVGDWTKAKALYPGRIGKITDIKFNYTLNKEYAMLVDQSGDVYGVYLDHLVKIEVPATSEKQVQSIEEDDTVYVTSVQSSNFGKVGTATFVAHADSGIIVSVEFADGGEGIVNQSELAVVPNPKKLKVGNTVKLVDVGPSYYGKVGVIKHINYSASYDSLFAEIEIDGKIEEFSFAALKKVNNPNNKTRPLFTIGDKVEVIKPTLLSFGKKGEVIKISNLNSGKYSYFLRWENGEESTYYFESELKKIS